MAYSMREFRHDIARGDTILQRRLAGWRWQIANSARAAASSPEPSKLRVVFAIPLISRARAADWSGVQDCLAATIASLRRQDDPRWQAIVCCQDKPELISFDERVHFLAFDRTPAGYDNHQKTATVRRWLAAKGGAGYYFPLDADDLLHPSLVGHILGDNNRGGYLIERGYMLDHATGDIAVLQPADASYPQSTEFHRSCGSSSALWFDFDSGADYGTLLAARGNHRKVVRNMAAYGVAVKTIPFHAAIYVMNHADNLRRKRGLMAGKMKHFDINPVRDPARRAEIAATFGLAELFPGRWPPGEG